MPEIDPNEKLLLQVIHDLREFMPFFVLVGGWVPFIYAKYAWGNISNLAVHTSDIDFGVLNKEIEYFDILLESIATINIGRQIIQIPTDSMFVFHKLLTFIQRENKEKLRKDLYYIYYMLRFCPQKERLLREIQSLIKYKDQGKEVLSNIHKYFSNMDSKGPILIEQENGPDSFIKNIREDAFKRITQLLI